MNDKSDHAPYVGPGVVSGADRGSLAMERIIRSRRALGIRGVRFAYY